MKKLINLVFIVLLLISTGAGVWAEEWLINDEFGIPGWREHRVNILDDYRKVFGKGPPARASLAVMSDTDNTGGRGRGFLDFIRVGR